MSAKLTLQAFEATKRRRQPVLTPRAIAYLRVSTEEQQLGPEAQEAAIRTYAAQRGLEIVAVFRDQVSGAAPLDARPGLIEALDALGREGASVLLVHRRDRLARDTAQAAFVSRLVEHSGARIESADGVAAGDAPEDRLLRTILDGLAEYERALIRVRTKGALAAKRRRGERLGRPPFGFQLVAGQLQEDRDQQATIRHIISLRQQFRPWAEIAEILNIEHRKPARGVRWYRASVQRIHAAAVRRGAST